MRNRLYFLAFLVSLLASPLAHPAPAASSAAPLSSRASVTSSSADAEVAALREQNKVMRDYHSSLLDTVYWSLTGVFAIAALLAGFGWWSNFKVYEKDKQRLENDMELKFLALSAQLTLQLETARSEMERTVDAKNDQHAMRLSTETSEIRSRATEIASSLSALEEELRRKEKAINDEVEKLSRSDQETMATLREVEEHIWEVKKIFSNILVTQCQGLSAAVKAKNQYLVKEILTRMMNTIKTNFVSSNRSLRASTRQLIEDYLMSAKGSNEIQVIETLAQLNKVKIQEEDETTSNATNQAV